MLKRKIEQAIFLPLKFEKLNTLRKSNQLKKLKDVTKMNEKKKITVAEAASIMGVSKLYIRVGLREGTLPFGTAVKLSSKWTFHIVPSKFYEYIGQK